MAKRKSPSTKPIRVGVVGVGRGQTFMHQAPLAGMQLVAMSIVGILAWKSALQEGAPFTVPDMRDERQRKAYENDEWSPFPEDAGPDQPPPASAATSSPALRPCATRERCGRRSATRIRRCTRMAFTRCWDEEVRGWQLHAHWKA